MGKGDGGKSSRSSTSTKQQAQCQVDGCSARLSNCKGYYQRYRVCQQHLAAESVFIDGVESRFCQQCGRFQELSEFDDTKRSCRTRLAHHNSMRQQRRREAATAQLLARSVPDLPRSSRPSAARTPGAFCSLLNSPDHWGEDDNDAHQQQQQQRAAGGSSSSLRTQSTAAAHGREGQQAGHAQVLAGHADALQASAGHLQACSQGPDSRAWLQQLNLEADRAPAQHSLGNSRWTEETALAFFTRASRQPQQQQQQERTSAPMYSNESGAAAGASTNTTSQALVPAGLPPHSLLMPGMLPFPAEHRDVYSTPASGNFPPAVDAIWGPAAGSNSSSSHGQSPAALLQVGAQGAAGPEGCMPVSTDSRSSASAAASGGAAGFDRAHLHSSMAQAPTHTAQGQLLQGQGHLHSRSHVAGLSSSRAVPGPAVRAPDMRAVLAVEGSGVQHKQFAGVSAHGHPVTAMHSHMAPYGHLMQLSHTPGSTAAGYCARGAVGAGHAGHTLQQQQQLLPQLQMPSQAPASAGLVGAPQQQMLAPLQRNVLLPQRAGAAPLGPSATSQHCAPGSHQAWAPGSGSNSGQLPREHEDLSRLGSNSSSTTHNMQRSGSSAAAAAHLQQGPRPTPQHQELHSAGQQRPSDAVVDAASAPAEGAPADCLPVQAGPATHLPDNASSDDWELQWTPTCAPEPIMGLLTPCSNSPMIELLAAAGHDEMPSTWVGASL